MPKTRTRKVIYVILSVLLLIAAIGVAGLFWVSYHYKQLIADRLPGIVSRSTDSIYHISFRDININIFTHNVTLSDLKLWPDEKQVKALKSQHRHTPSTLSTVSISELEASGIAWGDMMSKRSVDCKNVVVHNLKWLMVCAPHPEDSLFSRDEPQKPYLDRISVSQVDFRNPVITYHYEGKKDSFFYFMKGGTATLNKWVYNYDEHRDTSLLLYAGNGKVRLDSFIFLKRNGRYTIKRPEMDFETSPNSVTLKGIRIKKMVDHNPQTGSEKEIYDLNLPSVQLVDFNWNKLITGSILQATKVVAEDPYIAIRYIDQNATDGTKKGSYPHQLLLQVGLQTDLMAINVKNGHLKYTEVTKKNNEAVLDFTHITGHFTNVTNMPGVIAKHKDCTIKLAGKFMDKSDVSSTFNLYLGDTTGRFTMDGILKNMDGDEVMKQAQAFTFVEVTSFHLNEMDMHIQGDETYAKGNFTVLYQDLKISLFKFKTNERKGKHGPMAFLGSALLLYTHNPMPGKDVRKVTTSFARDTTKGFIPLLWQNIYRAAKKTAVRDQNIIVLTDGKESDKGEQPKKSFFARLFGKKK